MMEPGHYADLTYAEYDAIDAVRSSDIRNALVSPKLYRHRREQPLPDSPAFKLGRATHTGVLEPMRYLDEYIMSPHESRRTKAYKDWAAEQSGKTILTADEYATIKAIAAAVRANPDAAKLLSAGEPETTLVWEDKATGLLCKARPDWLHEVAMVDLKTARDVDQRLFAQAAARYGYHAQMAHYLNGYSAVVGGDMLCYIVAVESSAPHDVVPYALPWMALSQGRDLCTEGLRVIKQAQDTGEYPGLAPDGIVPLELPSWAMGGDESEAA